MKTIALPIAFVAVLCATVVEAANTDWQDLGGGRARLVAELDPENLVVTGMVEMELLPGWKTYWREPGGSGIPPQFDFSGSSHFLPGEILFPVPNRLEVGGVVFAGYSDSVRFPFEGRFISADQEGEIALDLLAGVCEEICIPATASFRIGYDALQRSDPAAAGALALASQSLPRQASSEFSITGASLDDGHRLIIETRVPPGDGEPALFAEGPPGWYLTPAKLLQGDRTTAQFGLALDDIPADADPLATKLRYTLAKGGRGVEQWFAPDGNN